MRQQIALLVAGVALVSCATRTAPLVVKMSSDRRPTTSPARTIRTDGIYACRGLQCVGSPGGLGFWPLKGRATQQWLAAFLRFDEFGRVTSYDAQGPVTNED